MNDRFCAFDGSVAYATVADSLSQKRAQTVEAVLDLALEVLPANATTLFGKDTVGWRFEADLDGTVRFTSIRAGGSKSMASGTAALKLTAGKRYILFGKDDGTNVSLYVNGVVANATAVTSQTGALTTDTNPLYLMKDNAGSVLVAGRVYRAEVKLDGALAVQLRVRETTGNTLADSSDNGNDGTMVAASVVGTNHYFGMGWNREPSFRGSVSL